jgi:osmoprotectant transport system permease protein
MTRIVLLIFMLLALVGCGRSAGKAVQIGSKAFTESVIVGDIVQQACISDGISANHRQQLGGTRLCFNALLRGDIDIYPEYTGTIRQELLANQHVQNDEQMAAALAAMGIGMTRSLGFNDTYAVGMREARAAELGILTIGDLARHPELKFGFSNEFIDRKDGWPMLLRAYALPQKNVTGLDHDLAYRALADGAIDATDLYSTDAEIAYYKLRVLRDDRHVFPQYDAVLLYRLDLKQRVPAAVAVLDRLTGKIDAGQMIRMNAQAKLAKIPESEVAGQFLRSAFGGEASASAAGASLWEQLRQRTIEHLVLVAISLSAAIVVALPLGVLAAKVPWAGHVVVTLVAAIYTIPSLALLALMVPAMGIGTWPAVAALFLYSLLPMVRNTQAGLRSIPGELRDSALALGLPAWPRLIKLEVPMAAGSILAGIKTSAVINVGTATLGALVGAGGYGQPILTGIRLDDTRLILLGAIPAALLALAVQGGFGVLEYLVVPRTLRAGQRKS